jgi:hypothetical protein
MGRPKMTLPWGNMTVLARVLETLDLAMGDRGPPWSLLQGGDEIAVRAEVSRIAELFAARSAAAPGIPIRAKAGAILREQSRLPQRRDD